MHENEKRLDGFGGEWAQSSSSLAVAARNTNTTYRFQNPKYLYEQMLFEDREEAPGRVGGVQKKNMKVEGLKKDVNNCVS